VGRNTEKVGGYSRRSTVKEKGVPPRRGGRLTPIFFFSPPFPEVFKLSDVVVLNRLAKTGKKSKQRRHFRDGPP